MDVIGSSVYIAGEFQVYEYHAGFRKNDPTEHDLSVTRTLLHIEQQIRSLPEVTHAEFKLTNWHRVGFKWAPAHPF